MLELYAGCGPIGLGLLARSREVAFNEVVTGGPRTASRSASPPAPSASAPARA